MDAANFVLHPFTKQEHQEVDFTFQQGVEAVRILLPEGLDKSATSSTVPGRGNNLVRLLTRILLFAGTAAATAPREKETGGERDGVYMMRGEVVRVCA
ncbi:hypothetical protein SLA2020_430720 [Shorea laevis]